MFVNLPGFDFYHIWGKKKQTKQKNKTAARSSSLSVTMKARVSNIKAMTTREAQEKHLQLETPSQKVQYLSS